MWELYCQQLASKNNEQRQWSKPWLYVVHMLKKRVCYPICTNVHLLIMFWPIKSPLSSLFGKRNSVLVGAPAGYWTKTVLPLFLLFSILYYVLVFFPSLLSTVFSSLPLSLPNQHRFVLKDGTLILKYMEFIAPCHGRSKKPWKKWPNIHSISPLEQTHISSSQSTHPMVTQSFGGYLISH